MIVLIACQILYYYNMSRTPEMRGFDRGECQESRFPRCS